MQLWSNEELSSLEQQYCFDYTCNFRSSDDDYCPKSQVDCIQEKVLKALGSIYQVDKIVRDY